jgi:glutaminyl-peptide cyclotransferase
MKKIKLTLWLMIAMMAACGPDRKSPPPETETPEVRTTPKINYTVEKKYPHDPTAFTEGLLFYGDKLLESTGSPDHMPQTRSAFGELDLNTGKLDIKVELDKKIYFGEGIAVLNDKLYQLTYTNQVGFIYDAKTYKRLGQFAYNNKEGWGMTTDGQHLIMSDGTYNLTWLDPENFSVVKVLPVTKEGYGLDRLNELEYINGFIYANIWMSNLVVKIDPESGQVVGQIDFSALFKEAARQNNQISEMNGIAYDPAGDRILITGKMWPLIFEVNFPH